MIKDQNGSYVATPERAVTDVLYFNPLYHFDNPRAVNFKNVEFI
jgi:hypothetical protein